MPRRLLAAAPRRASARLGARTTAAAISREWVSETESSSRSRGAASAARRRAGAGAAARLPRPRPRPRAGAGRRGRAPSAPPPWRRSGRRGGGPGARAGVARSSSSAGAEDALGEPRAALERALEPLDLDQVDADPGGASSRRATLLVGERDGDPAEREAVLDPAAGDQRGEGVECTGGSRRSRRRRRSPARRPGRTPAGRRRAPARSRRRATSAAAWNSGSSPSVSLGLERLVDGRAEHGDELVADHARLGAAADPRERRSRSRTRRPRAGRWSAGRSPARRASASASSSGPRRLGIAGLGDQPGAECRAPRCPRRTPPRRRASRRRLAEVEAGRRLNLALDLAGARAGRCSRAGRGRARASAPSSGTAIANHDSPGSSVEQRRTRCSSGDVRVDHRRDVDAGRVGGRGQRRRDRLRERAAEQRLEHLRLRPGRVALGGDRGLDRRGRLEEDRGRAGRREARRRARCTRRSRPATRRRAASTATLSAVSVPKTSALSSTIPTAKPPVT